MIAAILLVTQHSIDREFLARYATANIVERDDLIRAYAGRCSLHVYVEQLFKEPVPGLISTFSLEVGRLPSKYRDTLIINLAGSMPLGYRAASILGALKWPSQEAKDWIFARLSKEGHDWSYDEQESAITTIVTCGTWADEVRLSKQVNLREFQGPLRQGRYWATRHPKRITRPVNATPL